MSEKERHQRRSADQVMATILTTARKDENIRIVILQGSRSNSRIAKDQFQDFDVIYGVRSFTGMKATPEWIDVFGERIILQMPNSMKLDASDNSAEQAQITYLMLFKDGNRIDLTVVKTEDLHRHHDSLNKVVLDKDSLLPDAGDPSDKDYWVRRPTQKQFTDSCNEFWWVTTYVIKGLARSQPLYARHHLEVPVRNMFMRMIAWWVGTNKGWSVNLGQHYRFLEQYLPPNIWKRVIMTFPDAVISNIWLSLEEMTKLFHRLSQEVANQNDLVYDLSEAENVQAYLEMMKSRYAGQEQNIIN